MKTFLSLLLLATLASADSKLFVMLASVHHTLDTIRENRNDFNPGLGYEYTADNGLGVQIGGYYNSFYKPTAFAGVHYEHKVLEDLTASVSLSGATGYEEAKGYPVVPIAIVGLQYKSMRIVTNLPFTVFTVKKNTITNIQFVYNF